MTTVRKVIGRLPVLIGDWDSDYREGQGYMKNNRVLIFNSELQSKIDNNTYPPATQNLQTGVITFDTTHWVVVSDGRNTIGLAEHIQDTSNPHGVTKSQVGLGNVGNFKAVSTEDSQGLSETEKTNARTNIGAGTSSFSGNYNDLSNTPNIYTQNEIDTKIGNIGNQSVKSYVDDVKNNAAYLNKNGDMLFAAEPTGYIIDQSQGDDTLPENMIRMACPAMDSNELAVSGNTIVAKDAIKRIHDATHIYVGRYNATSGKLEAKQVSDADKTKWANNGTAITLGDEDDVFMKLPEFWYKCYEIEEGSDRWQLLFTMDVNDTDNTWQHWEGNTFIGVYKGCIITREVEVEGVPTEVDKMYSKPGVTPTTSLKKTDGRYACYNRVGSYDRYNLIDYDSHKIMCLLGFGWLGTTDAVSVVGFGSRNYPKTTGLCNSLGMTDTVADANGGKSDRTSVDVSTNFWGLENWWGDTIEIMDNGVSISSGTLTIKPLNDSQESRAIPGVATSTSARPVAKLVLGNYGDVFKAKDGTVNKSYACYQRIRTSGSNYPMKRSGYETTDGRTNLCYCEIYSGVNSSNAATGTRLMYKGDYEIVDSFTE